MNRYTDFRIPLATALLTLAFGGPSVLVAQAPPQSVQVVLLEHFAAFEPDTERPPDAKPLAAVVLRRAPWDGGSIIVLSPAAATPQTLAAAIGALARPGDSNLLVLPAASPTPRLGTTVRAALEARLADLSAQEVAFIPKLGRGRTLTIADPLRLVQPKG